jgi:hypothetical protein
MTTRLKVGDKVGYAVSEVRALPIEMRYLSLQRGTIIQFRRNQHQELLAVVQWKDPDMDVSVVHLDRLRHCSSRSLSQRRQHA